MLFGFQLTRPFAIGAAVVCCAFYLYFGHFNQVLLLNQSSQADEAINLINRRDTSESGELLEQHSDREGAAESGAAADMQRVAVTIAHPAAGK